MAKLKISLWSVGRQSGCVSLMGISSGAALRAFSVSTVVNLATSNIRAVPKSLSCAMPSSDTVTLSYRGTEGLGHTDELQHTYIAMHNIFAMQILQAPGDINGLFDQRRMNYDERKIMEV